MKRRLGIYRFLAVMICVAAVLGCFGITAAAKLPSKPVHSDARSIILCDMDSGGVLYEDNADIPTDPASTTKVMTALMVLEAAERGEISLDDEVMATDEILSAIDTSASSINPCLVDGEIMTVLDYLKCAMVSSDCAACDVLAAHTLGSIKDFVFAMNQRAKELGCERTNFVNTHGYPVKGHISTARDLYKITMEALKYPIFVEIFGTVTCRIDATNKNEERVLYGTNYMLWAPAVIKSNLNSYYYPFMKGGKTGSSSQAGHCITGYAQRGDVRLICVVLGAELSTNPDGSRNRKSFSVSRQLYNWGFENFGYNTVLKKGDTIGEQTVSSGKDKTVELSLAKSLTALLPNELTAEDLEIKVTAYQNAVPAPINAGTELGKAEIYYNGELLDTIPLDAKQNIEKGLSTTYIILIAGIFTTVLLILTVAVIAVLISKKKRDLAQIEAPKEDIEVTKVEEKEISSKQNETEKQTVFAAGGKTTDKNTQE